MKTKVIEVTEKEIQQIKDSIEYTLDNYHNEAEKWASEARHIPVVQEYLEESLEDIRNCENILKKL